MGLNCSLAIYKLTRSVLSVFLGLYSPSSAEKQRNDKENKKDEKENLHYPFLVINAGIFSFQ
jgi:hypothetical protein